MSGLWGKNNSQCRAEPRTLAALPDLSSSAQDAMLPAKVYAMSVPNGTVFERKEWKGKGREYVCLLTDERENCELTGDPPCLVEREPATVSKVELHHTGHETDTDRVDSQFPTDSEEREGCAREWEDVNNSDAGGRDGKGRTEVAKVGDVDVPQPMDQDRILQEREEEQRPHKRLQDRSIRASCAPPFKVMPDLHDDCTTHKESDEHTKERASQELHEILLRGWRGSVTACTGVDGGASCLRGAFG